MKHVKHKLSNKTQMGLKKKKEVQKQHDFGFHEVSDYLE